MTTYTAAQWASYLAARRSRSGGRYFDKATQTMAVDASLTGLGEYTYGDGATLDLEFGGAARLDLAAGAVSGLAVAGRVTGELAIRGATTVATLTTGSASGTAGASTSATTLHKPTGAANWTASDLVGKWLKVTGGGGYDSARLTLRPIRANTTTTATVHGVTGMDSTTTFEIVTLASLVDGVSVSNRQCIEVTDCASPVVIEGVAFSGTSLNGLLEVADCDDVLITGCLLDENTVQASVLVSRCARVRIEHCLVTDSADIEVGNCDTVEVTGLTADAGGQCWVHDADTATIIGLSSVDAPSTVLRLERLRYGQAEVAASDGGATPVYLESCDNFECYGGAMTGTGNTGYGVEINGSGLYTLTGSTITGATNDVLFSDGGSTNAVAWATLTGTDYGRIEGHAGSATARGNTVKSIKYGNYLFNGSVDVSGRFLMYGYLNLSESHGLTATGTTASDALQLGAVAFARVDTTPANTGVRLPLGAALPGVLCIVYNAGANTLKVYHPPSGTIDGGTTAVSVTAGSRKMFVSTSNDGLGWYSLT